MESEKIIYLAYVYVMYYICICKGEGEICYNFFFVFRIPTTIVLFSSVQHLFYFLNGYKCYY